MSTSGCLTVSRSNRVSRGELETIPARWAKLLILNDPQLLAHPDVSYVGFTFLLVNKRAVLPAARTNNSVLNHILTALFVNNSVKT